MSCYATSLVSASLVLVQWPFCSTVARAKSALQTQSLTMLLVNLLCKNDRLYNNFIPSEWSDIDKLTSADA